MEPAELRYPVRVTQPVAWGEMDAFGHVNNAVYLRWFESARIAYFAQVGVAVSADDGSPWRPILARATVDFRKAIVWPDEVTIEAAVARFGNTSFTMLYRAHSRAQGLAAEGEAIVVLLDPATGQKVPVPQALRAAVEALQARG
jgi:acyl-CoA thioester hydrolase